MDVVKHGQWSSMDGSQMWIMVKP